MSDYIILSHPTKLLDVTLVAHAVDAVIKTLQYKGSCLYMPFPGAHGKLLLTLEYNSAGESETEWFLRTLAYYLGAELLASDGSRYFDGSPDNDTDSLDAVPPFEDECQPIRLLASFDVEIDASTRSNILRFFVENDYEITIESDGYTVFLASNSYLDIYSKPESPTLSAEIDCTFSGAGVYAEAVELCELLAAHLGGTVSFVEDSAITYTADRNFDKLRCAFYTPIRQQLAFAICDDRDGLQAYIGWGTDAFEPMPIRGTIITPFGRYEIERLLKEINTYGFSVVCDRRFLTRNTPCDGSDFYVREVLNAIWSNPFLNEKTDLTPEGMQGVGACISDLETALEIDPYAPFPVDMYLHLCDIIDRAPCDFKNTRDYGLHFPPGYMRDDVCYGFGHYLRRFKLPGYIQQCCTPAARDHVFFYRSFSGGLRIEVEISYGYLGDGSESPLGHNFAKGDDIQILDIGGTSVLRFVNGGLEDGLYRAEAEVYIRDELYRFAAASSDPADIDSFFDTMRGCISVEDWYDEQICAESPDPHAPGATYCMNLEKPECNAFGSRFPTGMNFLTKQGIKRAGPDLSPVDDSDEKNAFMKHLSDMFRNLYLNGDEDKKASEDDDSE